MYVLPIALRPALAKPFGPIHDTEGAIQATRGAVLIAVGDVVTRTFLERDILPRVMIIDGVTKRTQVEDAAEKLPRGVLRERVENPAGVLTEPLLAAMERAIERVEPTLIEVIGEEDLAALPAMMMAPDGAAICYGQPDEGVVVVMVTPEVRARAREIFQQLERR